MKRYSMEASCVDGPGYAVEYEDDNGEWVRHDDAEAAIRTARAEALRQVTRFVFGWKIAAQEDGDADAAEALERVLADLDRMVDKAEKETP